jgi:predicted TIM-barrel fold metal-dependent hydrolase
VIIDFHTHVYPPKAAHKAVANIGDYYGVPVRGRGTLDELLEVGKRAGIDKFVLLPAAEAAEQVRRINDYIAGLCKAHDELIGFGALHPDMPNAGEEVDRLIALGLRGIKIHGEFLRVNIDDDRMMKLYALLEGKLPVVFHMGNYRTTYSHPARLPPVLEAFPKLTVVAAHFGGWLLFDLALECLRHTSCYVDLSSASEFIGLTRMEELIALYGARRVLFGSDYPMFNPQEELATFGKLRLSDGDRELILCQNALRLLSGNEAPGGSGKP